MTEPLSELLTEASAREAYAAWREHPAEVQGCLACRCPWFAHHDRGGCVGCDRCPGFRPGPVPIRD